MYRRQPGGLHWNSAILVHVDPEIGLDCVGRIPCPKKILSDVENCAFVAVARQRHIHGLDAAKIVFGDILLQESKRLGIWFEAQNSRARIKTLEVKNRKPDMPSAIDDEWLSGIRLKKVNVLPENVVANDLEFAVIAVGYLVAIGKRLRLQLRRHQIGSGLLAHVFLKQQYGKASEQQAVGQLRSTFCLSTNDQPSLPKFSEFVLLQQRRNRATAEVTEIFWPAGLHERVWRGGRAVECGGLENRQAQCKIRSTL